MVEHMLGRDSSFLSFTMLIERLICASSVLIEWKKLFSDWIRFFIFLSEFISSFSSCGLGTWSKDLEFGSLVGIVNHHFQFLFLRLNHGFYILHHLKIFFYGLILAKKIRWWTLEWWLTIWLGGVVSRLTLWRVVMIVPVLFIILGLRYILIRIRPIRQTRLIKVMICQVGNIWKRGRGCNMNYH